ncbi:hypothetical protein Tco_0428317 [Tanacetum coccineum]
MGEAVATACYTLNSILVHTLNGKDIYELLKGKETLSSIFEYLDLCAILPHDYDDVQALEHRAGLRLCRKKFMSLESLDVWILVPCPDNYYLSSASNGFQIKLDGIWDVLTKQSSVSGERLSSGSVDVKTAFSTAGMIEVFIPSQPEGLQVSQNSQGIFINQLNNAQVILLKKFGLLIRHTIDTPMAERPTWMKIGRKLIDSSRIA